MRRNRWSALRSLVVRGAAAALLVLGASCDRAERPPTGERAARAITETAYVEYMAALTLALEEGRTGEDASARIAELGATPLTRSEIEAFAAQLRNDPERWGAVTLVVHQRVEELRGRARAGS